MIINFDELISEPKSVIWQGREYRVNEVSTALYLEVAHMQENGQNDFENLVSVAKKLIPDFDLDSFPVRLLPKLVNFIMAQSGEEDSDEEGGKKNGL